MMHYESFMTAKRIGLIVFTLAAVDGCGDNHSVPSTGISGLQGDSGLDSETPDSSANVADGGERAIDSDSNSAANDAASTTPQNEIDAAAAGQSSEAGSAGSSGDGTESTDAGVDAQMPGCTTNADCDDGIFCNGTELCILEPGVADLRNCQRGEPPCHSEACDEVRRTCDCGFRNGDGDSDGHKAKRCGGDDCDDDDKAIHPGAAERCDARDDDCDYSSVGSHDEDGDGFDSSECRNIDWMKLEWHTGPDLDDIRSDVNPMATEACDGVDNDCDFKVDETSDGVDRGLQWVFYRDKDGDGYGDVNVGAGDAIRAQCSNPPENWSLNHTDCDDTEPTVHPGIKESCNGIDDNCSGSVDESPFDEKPDFTDTALECAGKEGWIITACPADTGDCNADSQDGCEQALTTMCNCHACGSTCTFACGLAHCEEITSLATGVFFTCAVTSADGGMVACWGSNASGQLGDSSNNASSRPQRVARIDEALQVATGANHSCAVARTDRTLYCWGLDADGQLGVTETETEVTIPHAVRFESGSLTSVTDVAAGASHTCAVFGEGALACWGLGDDGQLADGQTGPHRAVLPGRVRRAPDGPYIDDARRVVAGYAHTCVLLENGTVACAGDNSLGQLGDNFSATKAGSLQPVDGLSDVDTIAAGTYHTCALSHGKVFCWGANDFGQLGFSGSSDGSVIEVDALHDVVSVATGTDFTCAVEADGTLLCWGSNYSGQLGNPSLPATPDPNPMPIKVPLEQVRAVFGGSGTHACAISYSGQTLCWGSDFAGELGDGTTSEEPQPVPQSVLTLAGSQACTPETP